MSWLFLPALVLSIFDSGLPLWLMYGITGAWLHVKLFFVVLLMVYHFWARMTVKKMATNQLRKSGIYYRWANEIPLVFLFVILVMVVVKPI